MTDRSVPQKSADAYRTISEVAEELKLPQHVLRFWETRFPQVKPLKRAGGRRFYRPEDVALLRAVQALLYGEGYTIKGVQRLLAEFGARHVAEALVRSRTAPPPIAAPERDGDAGDDADEDNGSEMPKDEPTRRAPPVPARPSPLEALPGRAREQASPATRSNSDASLAERLNGVLSELGECARILSTVHTI